MLLKRAFLALTVVLLATAVQAKDERYGQCLASCKAEYPEGNRYKRDTALGACSSGCYKADWSGRKVAEPKCYKEFGPGVNQRDACLRGVALYPEKRK